MPPPRNHFVRFGLPFLTLMVAGMYGLAYVGKGKYELRDAKERQLALMAEEDRVSLPKRSLTAPDLPDRRDSTPTPEEYEMKRIPR